MSVKIISTGKALPDMTVDNERLAELVETSDKWIRERTGIKTRRIAVEEKGIDLAAKAVRKALKDISPAQVGLVIAATVTPDKIVPSMGALIKRELKFENAIAFDINAACSGFIYGLWTARSLMQSSGIKYAVVVGAERLSRIVNWQDKTTCVLFGDGAGCAVLENSNEPGGGIISTYIKNYDDTDGVLSCGMRYPKIPFAPDEEDVIAVKMNGTQVFRFAVTAIEDAMKKVLLQAKLSADDVKFYVPHQANMRIITAAASRMKQPVEKFHMNIEHTGNVSAASIPMALDDLMETGKVKRGDNIMLVGFGGGLSAGAVLFEAV